MMIRTLAASFLAAAALAAGGCYGTTDVSADVPLAPIGGDVSVVTDYDYPVFYSGGVYYRYGDDGGWYRSHYHDRGFVRVDHVPDHIRRIERPEAYRHYHAQPMANRVHRHY